MNIRKNTDGSFGSTFSVILKLAFLIGATNFACNDKGSWKDLKAVSGSLNADSR